jgi:hypothetical protein
VYCGYIGGAGVEAGRGIAVDGSGAYVTGSTSSTQGTFPVTVGPRLTYNGGGVDAFVAKIVESCASKPHGDVNADGVVDVSDVFYLINSILAGGPAPLCSGDVNGDGLTNASDIFYLINYLFAGGPPPP